MVPLYMTTLTNLYLVDVATIRETLLCIIILNFPLRSKHSCTPKGPIPQG